MSVERIWNNEYFRKRLAVEKPGWVHVGGEVTSNRSRVKVKCPEGHVIETRARNVFCYECKECVAEQRRAEMEAEFFAALRTERYTPLERYKNAYTPIRVLCPNGSEWRVSKHSFMHKNQPHRCPCAKCKPKVKQSRKYRTPEEAAREALVKCKFRFDPKDYVNTRTPVPGEWVECGHKDVVLAYNLFRGTARCRTCAGRKKKMTAEYQAEVDKIRPGTLVLEEYKGAKVKILHRCPCGCEWRVTPNHFRRGYGCPECARRKLSEMRRGENCNFYNPDLTDEEREAERNMPEDREWKRRVKARDNFTCQYCGKRGGKLNSHHLFAYNQYEPLRHELLNGITLCARCHYEKGHPRGLVGDETIYEFIDTIRKDFETADGAQKERLANLLAEMKRRVPILEALLNENNTKEEVKELVAV